MFSSKMVPWVAASVLRSFAFFSVCFKLSLFHHIRQNRTFKLLVKLRRQGFRAALPSVCVANVHSLCNKTDELLLINKANKDLSRSTLLSEHICTVLFIILHSPPGAPCNGSVKENKGRQNLILY